MLAAPRLAGQHASYLAEQLHNYRIGARGTHPDDAAGQTMRTATLGLSDGDIEALAEHFAGLGGDATETDAVYAGAALYRQHCVACHGAAGEGFASIRTPRLDILSPWYLRSQMDAYRQGWRGASDAASSRSRFMRSMADHLTDEDQIDSVVEYLTGQAP